MKITILLCSLLLPAMMSIWAQDLRNSISYFNNGSSGLNPVLDFSQAKNTPWDSPTIYTAESFGNPYDYILGRHHATVSDFTGHELFTTDGVNVWQNTQSGHLLLKGKLNGADFSNGSYFQNVIIVPRPLHPMCYYIVTTSSNGLFYSEVDLEAMALKNINTSLKTDDAIEIAITGNYSNAITATTHANGIDYWIVAHVKNDKYNGLYSYLVTRNGIAQDPKHSIETPNAEAGTNLKISRSGDNIERFALANEGAFHSGTFDADKGELTRDSLTVGSAYSRTISVEFASKQKNDLFVLHENGDLYRNELLIESNPNYKSLQIGQDEKLYISSSVNKVEQKNAQTNYLQSAELTLNEQTVTSAMAQLVPFNKCFIPTVPAFDTKLFEQDFDINKLPTTSLNGISGTWKSTKGTTENNYTFIPDDDQCATETTISIVSFSTNSLVANDDTFNKFTYMDKLLVTPSVLDNDLYNNSPATTKNVTASFVSLVADTDSYLPADEEFYACTGKSYADFFTSDGTYAVPWSCFPSSGTFILTYRISSNLCPNDFATATATLSFDTVSHSGKHANTDEILNDAVVIYPNPSDGLFNIDLTHVKGDYNAIKVYSLLGEPIAESQLMLKQLNAIDLSNIPTGYYIAHLSGDTDNTTVKLIKK